MPSSGGPTPRMDLRNENSATEAAATVDLDPDFEPQCRPRSCTWPLPRPDFAAKPPDLPEVGSGLGEKIHNKKGHSDPILLPSRLPELAGSPQLGILGAVTGSRKGGSRRNAWGNQSYAELISQAIESAPEKRLTLAQIYEWMVRTVPYFKDKGDSNSSAGWKNSIRHNLSLHSKFIKVHNEATGKSSWWMLNPEGGKSGKAHRRRAASMDSSSKVLRGRSKALKKKPAVLPAPPEGVTPSPLDHFAKWSGSPCSRNREEADIWTTFRPRSSSNASTVSTQLSPLRSEPEVLVEDEIPASVKSCAEAVPPTLNEDLELLDGLDLSSSSSLLSRNHLSGFSLQYPGVTGSLPTYSTSLFSTTEGPLSVREGCFSNSQSLEVLLTPDTPPPPADVLMTQVDPILSQASTLLLREGIPSSNKPATGVSLCPKPLEAPGPQTLGPSFSTIAPPPVMASASIPKTLGTPVFISPIETASQDRMPQDIDLDMYMENLECDMDNIISDLMDGGEGLDFNFEPDP
ncbi:forkhead box protein O4 [Rhynchocyon petersi]